VSQNRNEGERRRGNVGRLLTLDEAKETVNHACAPQSIVVTTKVKASGCRFRIGVRECLRSCRVVGGGQLLLIGLCILRCGLAWLPSVAMGSQTNSSSHVLGGIHHKIAKIKPILL
jgi:hypothetical protein